MAQKKTITFSYIFKKTQPCNITAWKKLDVNVCNLKNKEKKKAWLISGDILYEKGKNNESWILISYL